MKPRSKTSTATGSTSGGGLAYAKALGARYLLRIWTFDDREYIQVGPFQRHTFHGESEKDADPPVRDAQDNLQLQKPRQCLDASRRKSKSGCNKCARAGPKAGYSGCLASVSANHRICLCCQ